MTPAEKEITENQKELELLRLLWLAAAKDPKESKRLADRIDMLLDLRVELLKLQ